MFSFTSVVMDRVSLLSNRYPKTEISSRDLGINVIFLAMMLLGGLWALSVWTGKAAECFEQNEKYHNEIQCCRG